MKNLITVFMNYKVSRLIEYGIIIYQEDSPFIRKVFTNYFQTYIDNYYYKIFNTIEDDNNYNRKNLKLELNGIMEEMLYDYRRFRFVEADNKPINIHERIIRELRDLSFEIVRLDVIEISNKEEISSIIEKFVDDNELIKKYLGKGLNKLISSVKDTYMKVGKLLQYEDNYYKFSKKKFVNCDECILLGLSPNIKTLNNYRKGLVSKTYQNEMLDLKKFKCLVQKISYRLLMNSLEHKKSTQCIVILPDSLVKRGKICEEVLSIMDNPMFSKNVILGVNYNLYLNQKSAFSIDIMLACLQDFSHISDIYQKVDSIYQEGVFNYLIVNNCRDEDLDFFREYENDVMKVLLVEEE